MYSVSTESSSILKYHQESRINSNQEIGSVRETEEWPHLVKDGVWLRSGGSIKSSYIFTSFSMIDTRNDWKVKDIYSFICDFGSAI